MALLKFSTTLLFITAVLSNTNASPVPPPIPITTNSNTATKVLVLSPRQHAPTPTPTTSTSDSSTPGWTSTPSALLSTPIIIAILIAFILLLFLLRYLGFFRLLSSYSTSINASLSSRSHEPSDRKLQRYRRGYGVGNVIYPEGGKLKSREFNGDLAALKSNEYVGDAEAPHRQEMVNLWATYYNASPWPYEINVWQS
ncbi:hypothetical protein G7Y89_g8584 [Cudoniella acicularis]|uniref:Uncharacterized protein n=1 Tax=Cudoniella acicularis TaxID=354080 RepID=A0A8H4RHW8_9HELO|nr:hypothetical protein G7Y89_g8584 [Cudoniella acicularis]